MTPKQLAQQLHHYLKKGGWGEIDSYWFRLIAEGATDGEGEEAGYAKSLEGVLREVAAALPHPRKGLSLHKPSVPVEEPQFLACMDGRQFGMVVQREQGMGDLEWEFHDMLGTKQFSRADLFELLPKLEQWADDPHGIKAS